VRDGRRRGRPVPRAASELGAHVSRIRPSLSELSTPGEVQHAARLLGRLYDAVECLGMEPALVRQVGDGAGVPVYDGLASARHPTARIAGLLGGDASEADNRRFVVQAVLLGSLDAGEHLPAVGRCRLPMLAGLLSSGSSAQTSAHGGVR
jgi:ornithine carbamoyltransferase